MANLYVLEQANIFASDTDPTASKHLAIESVKLPALEEKFEDHHGAGAPAAIQIPVGIEAFKVEFKMLGYDPQLIGLFGLGSPYRHNFTIYGGMRDQITGEAHELKCVVNGRLGKIEQGEFKKGDLNMADYEILGLMRYEVYFKGLEQIFWAYASNSWRVNGQDQNAAMNRILRIPQA